MAAATPSAVSSSTATSPATTPTTNALVPGPSRESGRTLPSTVATVRTMPDREFMVMLVEQTGTVKDRNGCCEKALVLADILLVVLDLIGRRSEEVGRTKAEGR